jgi:hypothetical protein
MIAGALEEIWTGRDPAPFKNQKRLPGNRQTRKVRTACAHRTSINCRAMLHCRTSITISSNTGSAHKEEWESQQAKKMTTLRLKTKV